MLIENIYNQISIIEREIAVLPEEALQIRRSRIRITKKIKDKDYYYHRITHDGKRIENYVSFEQVLDLKEKIECRGLS